MKNFGYFTLLMVVIVIVLPLFIVKGCTIFKEKREEKTQELQKIKVYFHKDNEVREIYLDEYIKGVIAAEMPADYEIEALKAQAVAARTYAYARMNKLYASKNNTHEDADICTDSTHCQAWISKEDIMEKWGFLNSKKNWSKIEQAVEETKNIIITYDNEIINPVFHANSGGKTENAEDVWIGNGVPYLKSVVSLGEDEHPQYKKNITIDVETFKDKLCSAREDLQFESDDIIDDIEILEYTEGGRVKQIRIANIILSGTEFRKVFSLNSANFQIEKIENNQLAINTIGYGHGVGMSQTGANYLAKSGGSFKEILTYYYQGVEIDTIDNLEFIKNSK